ncbi:MAG: response regulator transcription factor [Bacillota bacterium]|nr:response regulator transcription factor [Bacillota bacterium]
MHNILICDDEKDIVSALKIYLSSENYRIFEAYNGKEALDVLKENDIHLILLDIMMPEMDGIEAAVKIRAESNIPVIFLSAKSEDTDKILGLNIGADDYITKPFNPMEVIARVKSHLRRYTMLGSLAGREDRTDYGVGGILVKDDERRVLVDGEEVNLTPMEYNILLLLMKNPGKVFSGKDIYRSVWKENPVGNEGSVAVHIRHLREKIEINPSEPRYLKVIWGQGYKIENIK